MKQRTTALVRYVCASRPRGSRSSLFYIEMMTFSSLANRDFVSLFAPVQASACCPKVKILPMRILMLLIYSLETNLLHSPLPPALAYFLGWRSVRRGWPRLGSIRLELSVGLNCRLPSFLPSFRNERCCVSAPGSLA